MLLKKPEKESTKTIPKTKNPKKSTFFKTTLIYCLIESNFEVLIELSRKKSMLQNLPFLQN